MNTNEKELIAQAVNDDEGLLISFSRPFIFEGTTYTSIDLTPIESMTAADMIAVNKSMNLGASVSVMPEVSLEFAINLAARATAMPVEFFEALPAKDALRVKNRVTGFLFGSD